MMKTFNYRYIIFYSLSILFVIILFNTVTTYGANNLKAAPPIGGVYLIREAKIIGCFQSSPLTLNLEQSGIYLAGKLSDNAKTLLLTGRVRGDKLKLESSKICNLTLTGKVIKPNIKGELKDNSSSAIFPVTLEPDQREQKPLGKGATH
ncbi:MAG: hypothetical protein N5P05_001230 [Chroococcopsis gigantea SAG 12.99]|jgi:hypothetical protein|nr:hypothetical protein [Chlorogloea purpurea SAG 13.99]MDV2999624.1 hypothetical protein [Chroococcopsis gigantea SAG 12.99]